MKIYHVNTKILPEDKGVSTMVVHLQENLPGYEYAFDFQGTFEKCLEYIDGIVPYEVIGSEEKPVTTFEVSARVAW